MNGDPLLLLRLASAMAALLAVAAVLARALGRPLRVEVAVASLALPILVLLPWLAGDRILLPTGNLSRGIPGTGVAQSQDPHSLVLNDVSLLLAPWEIEVRRQLAAGRLPLWSDRIDGGSSPWADPQVSVLSPTSLLARLLPARHHFLAALILKIELALCGAWVAARRLGSRRRGALFAASGFAIGGGILAWGLFPHSSVAAWAPWCLAAAIAIARRPAPAVRAGAAAAILGLLLAGQPEVAFASGGIAGITTLLYGRRRRRMAALGRLAVAGALAFGLAAPVIAPFLAIVGGSQRAHDRGVELERALSEEATHPGRAVRWIDSQAARTLLAPLSPWSAGVPYASATHATRLFQHSGFTGLAVLAGAAAALALRSTRRRALPMALLAGVIYGLGARLPPLDWIWSRVPGLQLQEPTRMIPLAALCLALAAAHGFDRWLRPRRQATARRIAAVVACALVAALLVAPARGVVVMTAAAVLVALVAVPFPRAAMAILGLALLVEQVSWGRRLLPPGDPRLFYPTTRDVEEIVRVAGGPGGRAVGHDVLSYPALFSTYGLSDPRTHNPLASVGYNRVLAAAFGFAPDMWHYFGRFRRPEHPMLDFLGVRAVISNRFLPEIPGMRKLPLSNPYFFVAVNRDALPRAFVTRSFESVEKEALAEWIDAMTDPRKVALDPVEIAQRLPRSGLRDGRARIVADRDRQLSVEVLGAGPRLLVTSIRGPAGWRARAADGRLIRTVTINGAFLGLVVPPKVRLVELEYRPPGLGIGLLLAGASSVASAAGLVALSRRRRRAATG